jgi:hypothetical protein
MDDPELGDVITHSGGVPGYGSNMRWVRGRRTAVIALANSTYAPVTELTAQILDLIYKQGFIPDASPLAGEHVTSVAEPLVALVNEWDDSKADGLFADNVQLDEAYVRRRVTAESFRPITLDRVEVESEASGKAHCTDANGQRVEVSFSLAPIHPPRIQDYELKTTVPGTQGRTT